MSCMHLPCPTHEPVNCDENLGQMKVQKTVDCCQYDICGEFAYFNHLYFNVFHTKTHLKETHAKSKIQTKRQCDIYITKTV